MRITAISFSLRSRESVIAMVDRVYAVMRSNSNQNLLIIIIIIMINEEAHALAQRCSLERRELERVRGKRSVARSCFTSLD